MNRRCASAAVSAALLLSACAGESTSAEVCGALDRVEAEWFETSVGFDLSSLESGFDDEAFDALDELADVATRHPDTSIADAGDELADLHDGNGGLIVTVSGDQVARAARPISAICGRTSVTQTAASPTTTQWVVEDLDGDVDSSARALTDELVEIAAARDMDRLLAVADGANVGALEFFLDAGPYVVGDCTRFNGEVGCRVYNPEGIGDFEIEFTTDGRRVLDVVYVGGA